MNCPSCYKAIGLDQYAYGRWNEIKDSAGAVVECRRTLYIFCDSCGAIETLLAQDGQTERIIGHRHASRPCDANRILSRLPCGCRTPLGRRSRTIYEPAEVGA